MPCHGNSGIRPFAGGKCHPRSSFQPEHLLAPKSSTTRLLACSNGALAAIVRSLTPIAIVAVLSWTVPCASVRGPGWPIEREATKTLLEAKLIEMPRVSATATGPGPGDSTPFHVFLRDDIHQVVERATRLCPLNRGNQARP